jgi:hypothetical protein
MAPRVFTSISNQRVDGTVSPQAETAAREMPKARATAAAFPKNLMTSAVFIWIVKHV